MTGSVIFGCGLGRWLPAQASAVRPFHHPLPVSGRGWSPG